MKINVEYGLWIVYIDLQICVQFQILLLSVSANVVGDATYLLAVSEVVNLPCLSLLPSPVVTGKDLSYVAGC